MIRIGTVESEATPRCGNRHGFPDSNHCAPRWTDHFQDIRARQPGPERGCRAPPPEGATDLSIPIFSIDLASLELVACPRVARCVRFNN